MADDYLRTHTTQRHAAFMWFIVLVTLPGSLASSGCADGTREGLQGKDKISACSGYWHGHIRNSSVLCGAGWKVCSWKDEALLNSIAWTEAINVDGCFAFNAAQDGGRCRECKEDLEQDDLAGIGRGCPHQNLGQTSCISGGRIDASCCVDSHFHRACHYQPGIASGIVCCQLPVQAPKIIIRPREKMHVYTDLIFLLTCQARGMPPPRILWYKDWKQLPRNSSRLTVLSSGDLLVTMARTSDSGLYSCEVINEAGIDVASSFVTVTGESYKYSSGCSDGSTDGLHIHKNINACTGRWKGHVKRAKHLCSKGWRVCSPRDSGSLNDLTWGDIYDLGGCYAYNAANNKGRCSRCHTSHMAGVGRKCSRLRFSRGSCLSKGRIDVFSHKGASSCSYKEGLTKGVLCCKRRRKSVFKRPICNPSCQNRGVCTSANTCMCKDRYKGAMCQIPICKPSCGITAVCVRPGKCKCKDGFSGRRCRKKQNCAHSCFNGGRCRKGGCVCPPTHYGKSCQHLLHRLLLTHMNRTER